MIEIYQVTGCYVSNRKTLDYVKSFETVNEILVVCINVILAVVFAILLRNFQHYVKARWFDFYLIFNLLQAS